MGQVWVPTVLGELSGVLTVAVGAGGNCCRFSDWAGDECIWHCRMRTELYSPAGSFVGKMQLQVYQCHACFFTYSYRLQIQSHCALKYDPRNHS